MLSTGAPNADVARICRVTCSLGHAAQWEHGIWVGGDHMGLVSSYWTTRYRVDSFQLPDLSQSVDDGMYWSIAYTLNAGSRGAWAMLLYDSE